MELTFPPSDCTPCGRCCFSETQGYIRVFGVDEARMSPETRALTELRPEGRFMRYTGGACVALRVDASHRVLCSIYEERPDVCRALVRGSGQCRGDFDAKGAAAASFIAASRLARRS